MPQADILVNKWATGASYGPVLSQTDLYILNVELQLHPILQGADGSLRLIFSFAIGWTFAGSEARNRNVNFTPRDEPATWPRVTDIIIITELSPWCTIIHNDRGVTVGDVCGTIWKEYNENYITKEEFFSLPPRLQEYVRRRVWKPRSNGTPRPNRYKRVDWLRDRIHFDGLSKRDGYTTSRLGFKAPNIFVMHLTS